MKDEKELRTKKCSGTKCRMKVVAIKGRKYYCDFHFEKVRYNQKEDKYWEN